MKKTYGTILSMGALATLMLIGCGSGQQQQTDVASTEQPEVAAAPAEQPAPAQPAQEPAATTQQPATQQPAAKPAAKPASSGTTAKTEPAKPAVVEPEPPKMVTIPTGTVMLVALDQTLRTDSNKTGDTFRARTTDAVRIDDMTVIPAGSEVRGVLTNVEEPHRTAGKAQMTLEFREFVDANGNSYLIASEPVALEGEGDKISDEAKVGAGAVIGGVLGALTSKKKTKGAATGAVAGAAAGGAIALATKGKQIELPAGQQFSVELTAPVEVPASQLTAGK